MHCAEALQGGVAQLLHGGKARDIHCACHCTIPDVCRNTLGFPDVNVCDNHAHTRGSGSARNTLADS